MRHGCGGRAAVASGRGNGNACGSGIQKCQFHAITVRICAARDRVVDHIHAVQNCLLGSCNGVFTFACAIRLIWVADIIGNNLRVRRDAGNGDFSTVEIHIHKIAGNGAGGVGAVAFRVFRGHEVGGSVGSIAPGADNFVVTGIGILWIAVGGADAQVIAGPFIFKAVGRRIAEGRMVKVDAGIDNADQYAFAFAANTVRNSRAVPNVARANPFRTHFGVDGVGLVFQDFADAGQALQVFGFLRAQLNGDAVQDHVVDITDLDGTPQQAFRLRQHRLAIDCQAVQVVPAFNAVDARAALGSAERGAFEEHNVARDFGFVDHISRVDR